MRFMRNSLWLRLMITGVLILSSKLALAASPDVYYGGFAFAGKFADIDKNFKYSKALNSAESGDAGTLEKTFREFFRSHSKEISAFNLRFSKAEQSNANSETMVLAVAVTREDFFTECLSDCTKAVLNLSLRVIFLDMSAKTIVNSFPVNLEIVDVVRQPIDDAYRSKLVKSAYLGSEPGQASILSIIKENLPSYRVASTNIRNLQVRNVTIDDKAAKVLFGDKAPTITDAYKDSIAQRFSDELSRGAKVSVLPIGRDALNGKCSLVFADGKEQDFKIPDASYAIDVNLQDLQTKNLDANDIEKAIAFGAFLNVRVYEPEFNTEFFQKRVIQGSAKKFAVTTKEYDEQGIFREVIQLALKKAVAEMSNDNKMKKEVISKCAVY